MFPYGPILGFLAAFAVFLLPGYGWVTWLHRRDAFPWPVRCALGFAWSMAVFGLLSWPFLWYRLSFASFLTLLYPSWGVFTLIGVVAYIRSRRDRSHEQEPSGESFHEIEPPVVPFKQCLVPLILVLVYLAAIFAAAFYSPKLRHKLETDPGSREHITWCILVGSGAALLFAAGYGLYRFLRARCPSALRFAGEDLGPAPKLWWVIATIAVLIQAGSSVVCDRPDWDDCFYLAAVLDYQHAEALNSEEPTHREGFPMPPIYWTLCWELWGAVLCHVSGLNPLVVFHTLLPGPLVLLSYAACAGLFAELLPRRWVPLALLGLSAFHLWGLSSHDGAANFLLPRPWQGKTVLLQIAVPLIVLMLSRYAFGVRQRSCRFVQDETRGESGSQSSAVDKAAAALSHSKDWRSWLSLTACVFFGLAVSLSAIFMETALVFCLALALVWSVKSGRVRFLLGAWLALLPLVLCGLALRAAVQAESAVKGDAVATGSWLSTVEGLTAHGSAEIVWLLTLPLLAGLLGGYRGRAYPIVFPIILLATFANPFLYDVVAGNFTSYYTYFRLLWLFPVGVGLGALVALTTRIVVLLLPEPSRRFSMVSAPVLAAFGIGLTWFLPSLYVWSPRNNFIGPLGEPHLAENLEKMPGDLKPLAERLKQEYQKPENREARMLCGDESASFLTPYSRDFRFVQTRFFYTPLYCWKVGRTREGLERFRLASVLYQGRFPQDLPESDQNWLNYWFPAIPLDDPGGADFDELLDRYHVRFVVLGPDDKGEKEFRRHGFEMIERCGRFTLLKRKGSV